MSPIKLPQEFYDLTSRAILPMHEKIAVHVGQAMSLPRTAIVTVVSPTGFSVLVIMLAKRRQHRKKKEPVLESHCRLQFNVHLDFRYVREQEVLVAIDTAQRLGRGWSYCQELGLT